MNPIVESIIKNKFNYVHALEVNDVDELKSFLENFYTEFIALYHYDIVVDFCTSLSLYCLNDENEDEVYNFNIQNYLYQLN